MNQEVIGENGFAEQLVRTRLRTDRAERCLMGLMGAKLSVHQKDDCQRGPQMRRCVKSRFVLLLLCTWFWASVAGSPGEEVSLPEGFPDPGGSSKRYGIHMYLTTPAYTKEARRLLLQEANQVAKELSLTEELPLTENIVTFNVSPFARAYLYKGHVGTVKSRHYDYVSGRGWKFNELRVAGWSGVCANYARDYRWPSGRLDTNAAYNLATQWLAAVSMDVAGLNRDCVMRSVPIPHWNRFRLNTPFTNATFTPMYYVYWVPRETTNEGAAAAVELFAPDKTLISLRVDDPEYILRKPLRFTNLDELLAHPSGHW